ncbi:MAG: hypothetical protein H6743_03730 [Rickettsiaceae bacterium]|nr:hypothetical protein [Rickettsiaceae bacterium]
MPDNQFLPKEEMDKYNVYVTQKEFVPLVIKVANLEGRMEDIMKQVSNHLPHQIAALEKSILQKIEEHGINSKLYFDNKINSHTRDVLDNKYADKKDTESFISDTKDIAKEVFGKIFWMLFFFFIAIVGTFIGINQFL